MTLLNLIVAIRHVHWHASYIKSTRIAHGPLYHNIAVVLCVYLMEKYASANADIERNKKTKESAPLPSLPISTASPSWNLTSSGTKMAGLPYCRDVTVGMFLPVSRHYHAAQPNAGRDVSFFSVISTTSLLHLRLWRQWDEGIWAYVTIELIGLNVFSYHTYCNALFIVFFLMCLRQVKVQKRMVHSRRVLAALLTDRARRSEDWRRGTVIWQWVKHRVYRQQALCAGVELIVNVGRSSGESKIDWHRYYV